jgi:anti-sigma regulatory factor (Ser/Thr protein kinase)
VSSVLRLRLPLRRSSARRLRLSVTALLDAGGVPAKAAGEVLLAADEAFTNAFMHSGDVTGEVRVRAEIRESHVLVEIRDGGCGFDTRAVDMTATPDPLLAHGRGLFLIHHLMDEVEVSSRNSGSGTVVRMVKRFQRRPARAVAAHG